MCQKGRTRRNEKTVWGEEFSFDPFLVILRDCQNILFSVLDKVLADTSLTPLNHRLRMCELETESRKDYSRPEGCKRNKKD